MTETELLAEVVQLLDQLGLLWHHCNDSRKCSGSRGFPDLVIVGPRGLIFAELKDEDHGPTADQDRWFWALGEATGRPVQCHIWRPHNLSSGRIRLTLKTIA